MCELKQTVPTNPEWYIRFGKSTNRELKKKQKLYLIHIAINRWVNAKILLLTNLLLIEKRKRDHMLKLKNREL